MALNELKLQRLVVDAVTQHGGFAFKMSNRFLAGIPDLFVQIPAYPTSIWEVKISQPAQTRGYCNMKVTPLQWQALSRHRAAGGLGGVISFLKRDNGWCVTIRSELGTNLIVDNHILLVRGKREKIIVDELKRSLAWQMEQIGSLRRETRRMASTLSQQKPLSA